ncbi:MAG: uridine kinase [Oscillospiraceae bacterium]|nr:uridine kinase [Oscillospiraceae bacterium]
MMKDICSSILKLISNTGIAVVGIDGLGGAGKSTVSEKICSEIEQNNVHTILLHIDDFINVKAVRYNSAYPEWQCYYDLQWRYDYFNKIINQFENKINNSIEIELYDKDNDCYFTKKYDVIEKTVIVVEGIFLQRKELQGNFDYMIYIDVPEDVRMTRVLKRDTYIGNEQQIIDKYENRYFPAERKYFNEYHPERSADFVIGE